MFDPFEKRSWKLGHGSELELGPKARIMGILNVTPDSFSDGGEFETVDGALAQARDMLAAGADIIDVGGESTRPGADPVTEVEEQRRVLPVIEALKTESPCLISIDTYRATTARLAIDAGAHIINDVWGFQKDPDLAQVAKDKGAGVCAMHTGRERTKLEDVIADQLLFLGETLNVLEHAQIPGDHIVLDPGFGFAKEPDENITILARLEELHDLGYPLLVGTSRKRFIGHFTGQDADNRDIGTAATSVVARMKGGAVFRVHDVPSNRDALAIADATLSAQWARVK